MLVGVQFRACFGSQNFLSIHTSTEVSAVIRVGTFKALAFGFSQLSLFEQPPARENPAAEATKPSGKFVSRVKHVRTVAHTESRRKELACLLVSTWFGHIWKCRKICTNHIALGFVHSHFWHRASRPHFDRAPFKRARSSSPFSISHRIIRHHQQLSICQVSFGVVVAC